MSYQVTELTVSCWDSQSAGRVPVTSPRRRLPAGGGQSTSPEEHLPASSGERHQGHFASSEFLYALPTAALPPAPALLGTGVLSPCGSLPPSPPQTVCTTCRMPQMANKGDCVWFAIVTDRARQTPDLQATLFHPPKEI